MVIRTLRKVYMATTSVGNSSSGAVDTTIDYKMLKKRHDLLKNPFVLAGIVLPWIALHGFLKPHSERISFAEHSLFGGDNDAKK
uniref:Mitochondrial import receptor subunit TOM7 n=1 Tax=Loa loa TaxID=7209 RepID=A0A1I7VRY4_LOALO